MDVWLARENHKNPLKKENRIISNTLLEHFEMVMASQNMYLYYANIKRYIDYEPKKEKKLSRSLTRNVNPNPLNYTLLL